MILDSVKKIAGLAGSVADTMGRFANPIIIVVIFLAGIFSGIKIQGIQTDKYKSFLETSKAREQVAWSQYQRLRADSLVLTAAIEEQNAAVDSLSSTADRILAERQFAAEEALRWKTAADSLGIEVRKIINEVCVISMLDWGDFINSVDSLQVR